MVLFEKNRVVIGFIKNIDKYHPNLSGLTIDESCRIVDPLLSHDEIESLELEEEQDEERTSPNINTVRIINPINNIIDNLMNNKLRIKQLNFGNSLKNLTYIDSLVNQWA